MDQEKKTEYPIVSHILFANKQKIAWEKVEQYLKKYIGQSYVVKEYGDVIHIAGDFPDEYAESKYTKSLRGGTAKAKANAVQIIKDLVIGAVNRRWVENKNEKHAKNASGGWYRYDTMFGAAVRGSTEQETRVNIYEATLVVRSTEKGLFLYDIINIKKRASKPLES